MRWFQSQAEKHPEFAQTFAEARQREIAAFVATTGRRPYYGYEWANVNGAARSIAKNHVESLRSFNNER